MQLYVWIALGVFIVGVLINWLSLSRYHKEMQTLRGHETDRGEAEIRHRYRQGRMLGMIVKAAAIIVLCVGMALMA